jgi:phosphoribosylformylglycinamidine synthase
MPVQRFFRKISDNFEYCFNIESSSPLGPEEQKTLAWLLAETFEPENFSSESFLAKKPNGKIIELGARLNFETAFSTNAVSICRACGMLNIIRLERTRCYFFPSDADEVDFILKNHDRMTECLYSSPLETFETGVKPEKVFKVPLLTEGIEALRKINKELGLGMDDWDLQFNYNLFANVLHRDPTNVECFQLGQANSEHSRHWFFKGKMIIDGEAMPETLMQIIKAPLLANPKNSVIAFKDNSSAIRGNKILTIIPQKPGKGSPFHQKESVYHIIFTAETHNFPCGVAPFPGAETGTGGRIRDVQATGRGGLVVAGTAGYCTGNLLIPDYPIPGENDAFQYPDNLARPLKILIEESNGASDYGNKFGEPVIQGFVRTFGIKTLGDGRREWIKPIMFTGGVGQIDEAHLEKNSPQKEMLIIQIGGPAYRIGMGGGAASSMIQGENKEELDFNAVQRGDAEMEQKMNRVIRACVEMGENNPIVSVHDQGAGGPCNVLTELVDPAGGRIQIRNIALGDKTLSVLEIWGAEYQERNALLLDKSQLDNFLKICEREKVNCEVLGEITGDSRIVLCDTGDDSTPVNLELEKILGKIPQKNFQLTKIQKKLKPLELPENLDISKTIKEIFRLPSVGSKGYLVRKVDRSVTGLIARQQCCGPLQLPVSNVAAMAQSHFGLTGAALAIGEQPVKVLIDSARGARLAIGESLTNLVWALITDISDIKCSLNWMWPAKLPGEGPELYSAAQAARDLMIQLGMAVDGGKDSLSMAAKVGGEMIKAPGQMVVSCYAPMNDVTKIITPDLKRPGQSRLLYIDLSNGRLSLGGSALAQIHNQIGNESPDADGGSLKNMFLAIQQLIRDGLILAGHDRSDGGLITTLAEMALAGNCGLKANLPNGPNAISQLFSEELGLVIEYLPDNEDRILNILNNYGISPFRLGQTTIEKKVIVSAGDNAPLLNVDNGQLLEWWESTSDRLEQLQMNPDLAKEQSKTHRLRKNPEYRLSFEPVEININPGQSDFRPKVAILREEGSNGDREMTSAFWLAGFDVWDVTMTDLLKGDISLDDFRGLVSVGGFSYADVLDSGKGWAGIVRFNSKVQKLFDDFYNRKNTFSLHVCNGCQFSALLGWFPWKGIAEKEQPRFIRNNSRRFESRWVAVKILESPAIMLKDMAGSVLGIWVAHGEGRLYFPDKSILEKANQQKLIPLAFVDDDGNQTEKYPFNPNGSPQGLTGFCTPDGRHLAMMPHPERAFLQWQWPWLPEKIKRNTKASPWFKMFHNACKWCKEN